MRRLVKVGHRRPRGVGDGENGLVREGRGRGEHGEV